MDMINKNGLCLLLGLLGLAFCGCESDEGPTAAPPSDPEGYISQGWALFTANESTDALEVFQLAINLADQDYLDALEDFIEAAADSDEVAMNEATARMNSSRLQLVGALSGIGWATVKGLEFAGAGALTFDLGLDLAAALREANLPDSAEVERLNAEMLAGYACMNQLLEQWQQSNERIAELQLADPDWDFDHDAGTNYLDLRLMSAENYYFLADFFASREIALELNDQLGYDPDLSEADFNLATIEGQAALVQLIEALDDLI
jgi:hypothetical protein